MASLYNGVNQKPRFIILTRESATEHEPVMPYTYTQAYNWSAFGLQGDAALVLRATPSQYAAFIGALGNI